MFEMARDFVTNANLDGGPDDTAQAAIRHNGALLLDSSARLRRWQAWWEGQGK